MAKIDPATVTGDACIVGIGASAGGIFALQGLLQSLPAAPDLSLVVVLHLTAGEPTQLVRLMKHWTTRSVQFAVDGERPLPAHVYLAGPDDVLTLEAGVFRTRPLDGGQRRPGLDTIDVLLESLAEDRGPRALAVILSGSGDDGAAGALCVKQAGGVVLVQEPLTAMFDGMPRAVIARGAADYVLPISGITTQLVACASPSYVPPSSSVRWAEDVSAAVNTVVEMARRHAGVDLSRYKASPVLWRVQQRMEARRVGSFADYTSLLRDDISELERLIRGIPIHVTEFFRDAEAWSVLARDVIEPLIHDAANRPALRAWTPACATGEEAYSVAMLLSEHIEAARVPSDFQLFATDSSPEVLARASRGVFTAQAMNGVSPERRAKHFDSADGMSRVKHSLREKMVFAPQNLLADLPFIDVDLITCRNLFIYLEREAIDRALWILHVSLRMGGYLFLGRAEPLPSRQQGFEVVSSRWNIYRKVGPAAHTTVDLPAQPEDPAAVSPDLAIWQEEMRALNEELRVTNEQLNVANEDLNRANAQLKDKLGELEMQSRVLSAGEVMTMFLDAQLRVRWFTPAIAELFPLRAGDLGRRITDLAQRFHDTEFVADVLAVLRSEPRGEVEVRSHEGKWFLRRSRPFLSYAAIVGVAVTFTDISDVKRVEEINARNEELERFNKVTIGRELRMIELKREVNALRAERGEPPRYAVDDREHEHDDTTR